MRATLFFGPGDIRVEHVPDPAIEQPTDVIARVTHACICGSDLWFYRGKMAYEPGWRTGHEWIGVVEETGPDVRLLRKGMHVIAPFSFSDGECAFCRDHLYTSCERGGFWGQENDGGQGEAVRVPFADATLVPIPPEIEGDETLLARILPLTDVMSTGHHAALAARVGPGTTVAVVGDGAVGLCGVLASRRLGAERIVILGHHPERIELALRAGATDAVLTAGADVSDEVRDLTNGGAECVLECVGLVDSMNTAIHIARPGGTIGYVGVPFHDVAMDVLTLFRSNIGLDGGVAPVRAYIEDLLVDVLSGDLDPSFVLDMTVSLGDVSVGYAAMDHRTALKVMLRP